MKLQMVSSFELSSTFLAMMFDIWMISHDMFIQTSLFVKRFWALLALKTLLNLESGFLGLGFFLILKLIDLKCQRCTDNCGVHPFTKVCNEWCFFCERRTAWPARGSNRRRNIHILITQPHQSANRVFWLILKFIFIPIQRKRHFEFRYKNKRIQIHFCFNLHQIGNN